MPFSSSSPPPTMFLFGLVDSSTSPIFLLLPLVLLLPFSIFFLFKNNSDGSEPYVFEHIELNILPGDPKSKKPETEWLNMGYWKNTDIFPEACSALASHLLSLANLVPSGRTLDVAHATGDSLLLLKSPTSPFPRQSHLVGITSLPQHVRRAAVRLAGVYPKKGETVEVQCGDAVFRGEKESSAFKRHPLDPRGRERDEQSDEEEGGEGKSGVIREKEEEEKFDSIICLDAAYHFKTRELWLSQILSQGLKRGGTLAFTDILSSSSAPHQGYTISKSSEDTSTQPTRWSLFLLHWILLPLLSVPSANIIPLSSLGATMVRLGYEDVEIDDITEDVFPGFARFLAGREELSWRVMAKVVRRWSGGGGGGKGMLRFVTVTGRRPMGDGEKKE